MANQEHLDILKQGVQVWNQWREEHPDIRPDFIGADFLGADLSDASLGSASLPRANLSRAKLTAATFINADLSAVNLRDADLSAATFINADLSAANLTGATLTNADLSAANLTGATLTGANLHSANLTGADLKEASVGWTSFGNVDLSVVKNLETVKHGGPSTVGIDTIYRSQGKIPEAFLKGAGVPDSFIDYMRSLVGKPIDYYSCFISYSSKDQAFAERLYADLQSKGVRCWYAPHDMRIGEEIRPRIDESIRVHDKLLLVLSESSLASTWVKKEVETAFEKETQQNKLVLFPIRLDETVMHTSQAWAADIRRMRHIGDFIHWKQNDEYQQAFARLLRDLKA